MESKHQLITVVAIFLIMTISYISSSMYKEYLSNQLKIAMKGKELEIELERTKQMTILKSINTRKKEMKFHYA